MLSLNNLDAGHIYVRLDGQLKGTGKHDAHARNLERCPAKAEVVLVRMWGELRVGLVERDREQFRNTLPLACLMVVSSVVVAVMMVRQDVVRLN